MPDQPEAKVRGKAGAIGFSGPAANSAGEDFIRRRKSPPAGWGSRLSRHPIWSFSTKPTNHLDIDSRAALIEAINDYPGAVILGVARPLFA